MSEEEITGEEIDNLYERLNREAEEGGYHLNPDEEFVRDLVRGLIINIKRFGYMSCPCRLASGKREDDLDIICPCDYRDPDLADYGACYCALYVTRDVLEGKKRVQTIPERRPPEEVRETKKPEPAGKTEGSLPYPVWRCKVCGYLCARDKPPEVCPVCKAKRERFEIFMK